MHEIGIQHSFLCVYCTWFIPYRRAKGDRQCFFLQTNPRRSVWVLISCLLVFILHPLSSSLSRFEEYFRWLISVKKTLVTVGTTKPDLDEAQVTLKRLENLISDSVSGYDAAFLRGVPSHQDFSGQNVFINGEGLITGVIDWEFHMVKPAALAAAYPSWIRYNGTADPRFVDKNGQFSSFRMASPVDAKRLWQEYDAVRVNTLNPYSQ